MLRLCLFLLQEVDDESLIIHYEVICKTLRFEVVTKMFPPVGIESFQHSKLRGRLAAGTIETAIPRRTITTRRLGRRRCRGVPMSSENAS